MHLKPRDEQMTRRVQGQMVVTQFWGRNVHLTKTCFCHLSTLLFKIIITGWRRGGGTVRGTPKRQQCHLRGLGSRAVFTLMLFNNCLDFGKAPSV